MMRLPNDIRCHIEIIDPKWLGFCGTLYPVKQIARPFGAMSRCVCPRTKLFVDISGGAKLRMMKTTRANSRLGSSIPHGYC